MWLFRTARPAPVTFEKRIVQTADITNSNVFADMGVLTLTFTTGDNSFLVFWFDATVKDSDGAVARRGDFKLQIDGADISGTLRACFTNVGGGVGTIAIMGVTPVLAAGAHTLKVQWRNDNAATVVQCRPVAQAGIEGAQLTAIEFR